MIEKVIFDPRNSFQYSSFYVQGFIDLLGKDKLSFNISLFKELEDPGNDIRFIVEKKDGIIIKYYIQANDSYQIKEKDYLWCDVYGCINTRFELFPKDNFSKLVSLCPSFGIAPGTNVFAWRMALCCFMDAYNSILNRKEWNKSAFDFVVDKRANIKHYWARVYKGIKYRPHLNAYYPRESKSNYIFSLSTLWYSDDYNKNDEGVNLRRANFFRACKKLTEEGVCYFEGGFANRSSSQSLSKFEDCIVKPISMNEWITKSHDSCLVFNTPAFWDCHGWKLGEYLAMGKAIISTKLSNDLPAPLIHGENIHFVGNSIEEMKEAVAYIVSHPAYRMKLESGARQYWKRYGTPEKSLELLGIRNKQ